MGARVTGVSLAGSDLDDPEIWGAIYAAFLEHAVLIFPGQVGLTREHQQAFAGRFGPVLHQIPVTNRDPTDKTGKRLLQGQFGSDKVVTDGWHTDQTFLPVSVKAATLYAEVSDLLRC